MQSFFKKYRAEFLLLLAALLLPLFERVLPESLHIADQLRVIFIFAILGLGLNIVTGFCGLLHLGVAAFMAIGAYSFAILSCDIYPFQLGFWLSSVCATVIGALAGLILGLPTIRLRGDYLAIVTLGFGEIVQDSLRNLEAITKGTQGINPLPPPSFFGYLFSASNYMPWYYLFLGIVVVLVVFNHLLEFSPVGRALISIREDELAAGCMGVRAVRTKLLAFCLGAAVCALSGALWVSYLGSSGEPSNYDFQISVIALCIVIVGGLGSVKGVLLGALVMVGFNSIFLTKLSSFLTNSGLLTATSVFSAPNNWKYLVFGLALILMMRFRPQGLWPSEIVQAEVREKAEAEE